MAGGYGHLAEYADGDYYGHEGRGHAHGHDAGRRLRHGGWIGLATAALGGGHERRAAA